MATARLNFISSGKISFETRGWVAFKRQVSEEFLRRSRSEKAVYVIRLCPPFLIMYDSGESPVTYIGRGKFQQRMTSHLKSWISPLSRSLKDGKFEVLLAEPRAQNNVHFYRDVEADLISKFELEYGLIPVRNKKHESHDHHHEYSMKELHRAFGMGSGNHYHWSIWPSGVNRLRT